MIDKRPIEDFYFTQDEYDRYQAGEEVWKDVPGWEETYKISTCGRIQSVERMVDSGRGFKRKAPSTMMKFGKNKQEYILVVLRNKNNGVKTCLVSRLVALTFLKNPENKPEVNHIKNFKENNFLRNLEYNTRSENILNSFSDGSRIPSCQNKFGKDHICSKPILQIDKYTNEVIAEYEGLMDACRITGFQFKNMSACALGKRASCKGYKWVYKENYCLSLYPIKKASA